MNSSTKILVSTAEVMARWHAGIEHCCCWSWRASCHYTTSSCREVTAVAAVHTGPAATAAAAALLNNNGIPESFRHWSKTSNHKIQHINLFYCPPLRWKQPILSTFRSLQDSMEQNRVSRKSILSRWLFAWWRPLVSSTEMQDIDTASRHKDNTIHYRNLYVNNTHNLLIVIKAQSI